MTDFRSLGESNPEPILMKLWHGWLRPGPTPHMPSSVGPGNSTWSGHTRVCHITELLFFLFCFFVTTQGQVSWPIGTIYMPRVKTRVFGKGCAFCLSNIRLGPKGSTPIPQKNPQSEREYASRSQPNRRSSKIARSSMKIFASNFTDYRRDYQKVQN